MIAVTDEDLQRFDFKQGRWRQVPIEIEPNEFNRCYLSCKKLKMGHLLKTVDSTP